MEKKTFGRTGLVISPVIFGGIINTDETQSDADRYVSYAVDQGVNYFDVAPSYGDAQERLGPALAPYRNSVFLACKTLGRTAAVAEKELHESLKKLQTDHFDVYQLHSISAQQDVDTVFAESGAMETLLRAKKEGLIRHIGFSAHSEKLALQCVEQYDFDSVMFPLNWAMGINIGWGSQIAENAKANRRGFIAIKAMIHRSWREGETRVYPKSWCKPVFDNEKLAVAAMKYALAKGADALIPPGNFEHLKFMLAKINECQREPLNESEWTLLRTEADAVKDEMIFDTL